ncbi:hypothetical protein VTI28DRAFT_3737 [Corynascus sepedonium]
MSTEGAEEAIRYYSEALKLKEGLGQDDLVLRLNLAVAKVVKKYRPDAFYIHSGEDIKPLDDNKCYGSKNERTREKNVAAMTELRLARAPYEHNLDSLFNRANYDEGALNQPC